MEILEQPSIDIFSVRIDEPMTTLTSMVVAIVCFYAFYKLSKKKQLNKPALLFNYYFLLMGIATATGGLIGHGFLYLLSFGWKLPGWVVGIVSITLIERATIEYAKPYIKSSAAKFFLIFNIVEMLIVIAVTMITLDFKWVGIHSTFGFVAIVTPFHLWRFYKTHDRGSLLVLGGVVLASFAGFFFTTKISLHTWFNYNDISHTIMAIAVYVFYLGAVKIEKKLRMLPA